MNNQTFSNLQSKLLLKNSFHSIDTDLRYTSGEKLPFVSVGTTRLALMFREASKISQADRNYYVDLRQTHLALKLKSV